MMRWLSDNRTHPAEKRQAEKLVEGLKYHRILRHSGDKAVRLTFLREPLRPCRGWQSQLIIVKSA
jgi:hypothetical protein